MSLMKADTCCQAQGSDGGIIQTGVDIVMLVSHQSCMKHYGDIIASCSSCHALHEGIIVTIGDGHLMGICFLLKLEIKCFDFKRLNYFFVIFNI